MESFIYIGLNQTAWFKDESMVMYYGPYAAALSYIVTMLNNFEGSTKLYRGRPLHID